LVIAQTIFLLREFLNVTFSKTLLTDIHAVSEVSWPIAFFDRFFPVLGSGFGLGALGIFQCL
jgi:hypothetical protein